jgi:hypothetical protein
MAKFKGFLYKKQAENISLDKEEHSRMALV